MNLIVTRICIHENWKSKPRLEIYQSINVGSG